MKFIVFKYNDISSSCMVLFYKALDCMFVCNYDSDQNKLAQCPQNSVGNSKSTKISSVHNRKVSEVQ